MSRHRRTVEAESASDGSEDAQSDPAKGGDDATADWSDEGGATESGSAI